MFKRFLNGLVFGAGFGIAFVVIWVVGVSYLLPKALEAPYKEPTFANPHSAVVVSPDPSLVPESSREFSFFKDSESRMQIPHNGGILSMSLTTTPAHAERPNTYQLWLTDTELWQIKTVGEKVDIESLPYQEGASVRTLDSLMNESLGFAARQSTMTISDTEISKLKATGESWRDDTLNGKLKITVEGVVFILPDPYQT